MCETIYLSIYLVEREKRVGGVGDPAKAAEPEAEHSAHGRAACVTTSVGAGLRAVLQSPSPRRGATRSAMEK